MEPVAQAPGSPNNSAALVPRWVTASLATIALLAPLMSSVLWIDAYVGAHEYAAAGDTTYAWMPLLVAIPFLGWWVTSLGVAIALILALILSKTSKLETIVSGSLSVVVNAGAVVVIYGFYTLNFLEELDPDTGTASDGFPITPDSMALLYSGVGVLIVACILSTIIVLAGTRKLPNASQLAQEVDKG
jgi:hypothetical protein